MLGCSLQVKDTLDGIGVWVFKNLVFYRVDLFIHFFHSVHKIYRHLVQQDIQQMVRSLLAGTFILLEAIPDSI